MYLLARQEPSGRRRPRYIALAHIKDGKSLTETAQALRVTPRAVTKWLKWFMDEGVDRLEGIPAQQFGVDYSLNGVYELLKRLDMAWISARSVSPNADPLMQAESKKIWSRKYRPFCPLMSPLSKSMCGFRMKCA